jgi:hypothetical protein
MLRSAVGMTKKLGTSVQAAAVARSVSAAWVRGRCVAVISAATSAGRSSQNWSWNLSRSMERSTPPPGSRVWTTVPASVEPG